MTGIEIVEKIVEDFRKPLEALFRKHGGSDFRWIDPKSIEVAEWVRMKCMYGCDEYGRNAACPPNTPPVEQCRRFFREYTTAAVFHFATRVERPEDRHEWTRGINLELLQLERAVFLSGFRKAFLLFMDSCTLCRSCGKSRVSCKRPFESRPAPEAMAVDVFATVRGIGFPIDVLSKYDQEMNRYAFLMID